MRTCTKCGGEKSRDDFYVGRADCKSCSQKAMRAHRARPETKTRLKAYFSQPSVRARQNAQRKTPEAKARFIERLHATPSFVLSTALSRALKRRPSEPAISHAQIMALYESQLGKCALTRITMTWAEGKLLPTSISLDRINSKEGYTPGNVRLVCHAANMFKGAMTDDEMFAMAVALVLNLGPQRRELGMLTARSFA